MARDPAAAPQLLANKDIINIYKGDTFNTVGFENGILAKLTNAIPAYGRLTHIIDAAEYPRVYITSDIHSDLRKIVQMLVSSKLVTIPDISDAAFDPYNNDHIYNPHLITKSEWTGGRNILLVIIGDIVDGKRSFNNNHKAPFSQVDDPRGSFELLIFALLYNLRIKAQRLNSEIRFTLGNHEVMQILSTRTALNQSEYVHDTAQRFFSSVNMAYVDQRSRAIMPFLRLCPYYILTLMADDNIPEVVFVHGGLHTKEGDNYNSKYTSIRPIQEGIDMRAANPATPAIEVLTQCVTAAGDIGLPIIYSGTSGALWEGLYAQTMPCNSLGSVNSVTPRLIVVGHCPTVSRSEKFMRLIKGDLDYSGTLPNYSECDNGESNTGEQVDKNLCVLLDCPAGATKSAPAQDDDLNAPRVAFVDTSISRCLHIPRRNYEPYYREMDEAHKNRTIQMLRLRHEEERTIRYYNHIDRVKTSPINELIEEQIYPLPKVGGYRRTRRSKRSINKKRPRRSRRNVH